MAKKGLANRRLKSTVGVVAIIFITLFVSVVTYYYQEGRVDEGRVVLEVVELNERMIVVRNIGGRAATNLESIPPAVFDPPSVASGEKSVGKFTLELPGFTIVTVTSDNGGRASGSYGESQI